jgi:hypothetical protein
MEAVLVRVLVSYLHPMFGDQGLICLGCSGGSVYTDTIALGETLSVPNQAVEAASKLSSAFLSSTGSDGLLGLAFPSYASFFFPRRFKDTK